MTRITPRTCLYPLAGSLLVTFALSISLTFRSDHYCYAATCGEWLFPLQARLHVVVWYCWISLFVTFLAVRAFSPELRRFLRRPLLDRKVPIVRMHVTVSGLLAVIWILALYGIVCGVWWIRLQDYFVERGRTNGVFKGNQTLAAIALVGHLCDVTMGMVLIPISRHSALASFFSLSVSTTLTFHMFTAYTLFALVLTHGCLYVAWVPLFNDLSESLRMVFPVLNPTYLYNETWPGNSNTLGIWRASLIFTGIFAAAIMGLISITALPKNRMKHFNLFYYTHLLIIAAVVIICLHASTVFYCAAPGLSMWVLDWGMRLYELRQKLDGKVTSVGNGWYCLAVPLPRRRLDGCACTSPLAHFYLYHSDSSLSQLHPFTTITHLASQNIITPTSEDDFPIQFLFRKQSKNRPVPEPVPQKHGFALIKYLARRKKVLSAEWTDKLAGLADKAMLPPDAIENSHSTALYHTSSPPSTRSSSTAQFSRDHPQQVADIGVRAEGPYFTPADPSRYHTVICLVAGTGVSGAIAIVGAFIELKRQRAENLIGGSGCEPSPCGTLYQSSAPISSTKIWERCVVIWSVRANEYIDLPFLKENLASNLEVRVHLTGKDRPRLDMDQILADVHKTSPEGSNSTWVYLSGPNPFIDAGEKACKDIPGVEWYGARWSI